MKNKSIYDFSLDLSSKSAIPGGGGASALVGSLAASLTLMVYNLTTGKPKFVQHEEKLALISEKVLILRDDLLDLIQKDGDAFLPLSKAYSLPKDDPNRDSTLEECLKQAAKVPYDILQTVCKLVDSIEEIIPICSKLAVSDAACAATFAYSAINSAAINVKVNTKLMKDSSYSFYLNEAVDNLVSFYSVKAQQLYQSVYKEME